MGYQRPDFVVVFAVRRCEHDTAAQLLGQFKAERQGIFSELDVRRLIYDDSRPFKIVQALQNVAHGMDELLFEFEIQKFPFEKSKSAGLKTITAILYYMAPEARRRKR